MTDMEIILFDHAADMRAEWRAALERNTDKTDGLSIEVSDLPLDRQTGALVAPGNSYGFMDGGIDLAYSVILGWGVQDAVQAQIREAGGELLVGQAMVVMTMHHQFPHLVYAPTMRVPRRSLDPIETFLATKAAVRTAKRAGLERLVIPGMGSGTGQVRPDWCASLMLGGILAGIGEPWFPTTLREAVDEHYAWFLRDQG